MITLGSADANPTTILEAMAWGLIPVCSVQSGYEGFSSIRNISIDCIVTKNAKKMIDIKKLRKTISGKIYSDLDELNNKLQECNSSV